MSINTLFGHYELPGDPLLRTVVEGETALTTAPAPSPSIPGFDQPYQAPGMAQTLDEYSQARQQADQLVPRLGWGPNVNERRAVRERQVGIIADQLMQRQQAQEARAQALEKVQFERTKAFTEMIGKIKEHVPPELRKKALSSYAKYLKIPPEMAGPFADGLDYMMTYNPDSVDQFLGDLKGDRVPFNWIMDHLKDLPSLFKAAETMQELRTSPEQRGEAEAGVIRGLMRGLKQPTAPPAPPEPLAPVAQPAAEGAAPVREEPLGTPARDPDEYINGFYSPRTPEVSMSGGKATVKIAQDRQPFIQETNAKTGRIVRYGKYGNEVQVIERGSPAFYDQQTLVGIAAGKIQDPVGLLSPQDAQDIIDRGLTEDIRKAKGEAGARKSVELAYAAPITQATELAKAQAASLPMDITDPFSGEKLRIPAGMFDRLTSQWGEMFAAPLGKESANKLGLAGRVLSNITFLKEHFSEAKGVLGKGPFNDALSWLVNQSTTLLGKHNYGANTYKGDLAEGGALWGTVQNFLGQLSPVQAQYYQRLVDTLNTLVYMQSGSQITVKEMQEVQKALMGKWHEPARFEALLYGLDEIVSRYAHDLVQAESTPARHIKRGLAQRLETVTQDADTQRRGGKRTGLPKVEGPIRWGR